MKKLRLFIAVAIASTCISITALAGVWQPDNNQWKYLNDDGTYYVNCWQWIDGNNDGIAECYYFDVNGYCLMNTITPDGHTVDANGAWIENGIVQTQAIAVSQTAAPTETASAIVSATTQETNWTSKYPYISGMQKDMPASGSFWTVNISTGKYHGVSNVDGLSQENTRYYSGDAAVLEANGYVRCKKNGCR